MKRSIVCGVLAAAGAMMSGVSHADSDKGAIYVSPMAQYYFLDKDRISNNHAGYQIGLGYDITSDIAAEFNVANGSFHIDGSGAHQKLNAKTLDLLFKFMPNSTFRPYIIAGVGEMDDQIANYDKKQAWVAEGGGGVLVGLGPQTGSFRVQFRGEAKYRQEFMTVTEFGGPHDPGDVIVGVGVQLMFGAPTRPVAKAAPAPIPDSDGDGVTDDIDRCPNTPAGAKVDQYGCEFDQDGDGVVDRLDQCPDTPHGTPVDAKGCPLDSDGDGVVDTLDKCPNTPKGDKVDSVGCTIKDEIKLQGVNFATDSADLVPESDFVLGYAVATLKKYPDVVIEVRGHTDNKGSKKHNQQLSQRRADSVMQYLKAHGVTNAMTAKGYGEEHPIADNKTAEGRLENRRVTLHIERGL